MSQNKFKCVNCNTVFHPGCIKHMNTIHFIDELSVSASLKAEFSSELENSYLNELVKPTDTYIASSEVNIHKEQLQNSIVLSRKPANTV